MENIGNIWLEVDVSLLDTRILHPYSVLFVSDVPVSVRRMGDRCDCQCADVFASVSHVQSLPQTSWQVGVCCNNPEMASSDTCIFMT